MKIEKNKKIFVLMGLILSLFGFNFTFAVSELEDTIPPSINLIGESKISIYLDTVYEDMGATASDNIDGDITSLIVIGGDIVDTSKIGSYFITYNVEDSSLNSAVEIIREVIVIEKPISTVNFIIRNGEKIIWQGEENLNEEGTILVDGKNVDSRSVLGMLYFLDQEKEEFNISNLSFYDSVGFYLKCIVPKEEDELCDNWQYAVGSTTPWSSIDNTLLNGGEVVGIYFGNSHRVDLSDNDVYVGEPFLATSLKYNYENDEWIPLLDVSIGLTLPNEENEWDPILISKYLVDENGVANFNVDEPNTYSIGIVEDFYFPSYQVVVNKKPSGGGGGSYLAIIENEKEFSLPGAVDFLDKNKQGGDFGGQLYLDWVAIGLAKAGDEASFLKNEIIDYLKTNSLHSSIITDNERRAMAFMALGINPSTDTEIDYIEKIVSSFDGVQIGDDDLISDDIFGLIVLSHFDFNKKDEIIKNTVEYIISNQSEDGSWNNVDMTSAAIQALKNFDEISGVKDAISRAESYLKEAQAQDGGFGNSFSTSWAIQALSLNKSLNSEVDNAIKYLIKQQDEDGGMIGSDIKGRIWATAYTIPANLRLSWNTILEYFEKGETLLKEEENKEEDNVLIKEEKIVFESEEEQYPDIIETEELKVVQAQPIPKVVKNNVFKEEDIKNEENLSPNLLMASAISFEDANSHDFMSSMGIFLRGIQLWLGKLWGHLISLI